MLKKLKYISRKNNTVFSLVVRSDLNINSNSSCCIGCRYFNIVSGLCDLQFLGSSTYNSDIYDLCCKLTPAHYEGQLVYVINNDSNIK